MLGRPLQPKRKTGGHSPPKKFRHSSSVTIPPGFCLRPERRQGASAPAPCLFYVVGVRAYWVATGPLRTPQGMRCLSYTRWSRRTCCISSKSRSAPSCSDRTHHRPRLHSPASEQLLRDPRRRLREMRRPREQGLLTPCHWTSPAQGFAKRLQGRLHRSTRLLPSLHQCCLHRPRTVLHSARPDPAANVSVDSRWN